jgi:hypothetical protein
MDRWSPTGRLGAADRTADSVGQSDRRGAGRRAGEQRLSGWNLRSVEARRVTMPKRRDGRVTVLWPSHRRRRDRACGEPLPWHDQGRQAVPGRRGSGNPLLPATRTPTLTETAGTTPSTTAASSQPSRLTKACRSGTVVCSRRPRFCVVVPGPGCSQTRPVVRTERRFGRNLSGQQVQVVPERRRSDRCVLPGEPRH